MAVFTVFDPSAPTDYTEQQEATLQEDIDALSKIVNPTVIWDGDIPTNPADAKRLQSILDKYARALAGDECAYVQLRCWAGDQTARARAIQCGHLTADEVARGAACGMATDWAKRAAGRAYKDVLVKRSAIPWGESIPVEAVKGGQVGYVPPTPTYPGREAGNPNPAPVLTDPDKGVQTITPDTGGGPIGGGVTNPPPIVTVPNVTVQAGTDPVKQVFDSLGITDSGTQDVVKLIAVAAVLFLLLKGR